jgi:hypothetical protein
VTTVRTACDALRLRFSLARWDRPYDRGAVKIMVKPKLVFGENRDLDSVLCIQRVTEGEMYTVFGAENSPYSIKVRSYCRYKAIPHAWVVRNASRCGCMRQRVIQA